LLESRKKESEYKVWKGNFTESEPEFVYQSQKQENKNSRETIIKMYDHIR